MRRSAYPPLFAPRRKLVGVVFTGVRGSALSSPSFLARIMSVMPCANGLEAPRSMKPALNASKETCWKRTGFPSTSAMMAAMSLNDRSSGPRTAAWPTPLHEASRSNRAATAAMFARSAGGEFAVSVNGREETPRLFDRFDLAQDVVHE